MVVYLVYCVYLVYEESLVLCVYTSFEVYRASDDNENFNKFYF